MAVAVKKKATVYSEYRCDKCNRRLKKDHWIFSTFTRNRYCWPGEGCQKPRGDT